MKKHIIIITGPTASGKSDLSLEIAEQNRGEIINADIGSFYEPLTIGTAKPDWKNESIPHHLFDMLQSPVLYSIVQFRKDLLKICHEIWQRGNRPIIVGGSTMYIQACFYKQHDIEIDKTYVSELEQGAQSTESLWQQLHKIDKQRAGEIDPHDRYRIIRALAIYQSTGKAPSEFKQIFDPIATSFEVIECVRNREQLYERINKRVELMIEQGWVDEVKKLMHSPWQQFILDKKIIGYDDILLALLKDQAIEEVIPVIQQKTRNYAKRQITFLKKLQRDVLGHDDQQITFFERKI